MLAIGEVDRGFSSQGARDYLDDLYRVAIIETKELAAQIDGIRSATEKGWTGEAQLVFMSNLGIAEKKLELALEQVYNILQGEISKISSSMIEFDTKVVPRN